MFVSTKVSKLFWELFVAYYFRKILEFSSLIYIETYKKIWNKLHYFYITFQNILENIFNLIFDLLYTNI